MGANRACAAGERRCAAGSPAPRAGPRRRIAFTLVELLIVITIIGILAAVAIPQFSDSSTDAKIAALDQSLASIRSAIELYHHQHNDVYPGGIVTHRGSMAAAAQAHTDASDAFVKQLTTYSNAAGHTCAEKNTNYPYGPYLRQGMPINPLAHKAANGSEAAVKVTADTEALQADADAATGWKTSSVTGQFIANHADYDNR